MDEKNIGQRDGADLWVVKITVNLSGISAESNPDGMARKQAAKNAAADKLVGLLALVEDNSSRVCHF